MTNKKSNLKRNFFWNLIGSTFYAFTSLFFLVIVTRLNGVDEAGIFTFAFSNACVFQIIGTYTGRSYHVTEKETKTFSDSVYFYNRLITTLAMIILGLFFIVFRDYETAKILVVFLLILYKALDAVAEVMYGILQKNDRLDQVGVSLLIKAILGTGAFFVADYFSKSVIIASASLVVVNAIVMLSYDYPVVRKTGFKLGKPNWASSLKLIKVGFFAFAFAFLTQYLLYASKYSIDFFSNSDVQGIYGIIAMPATIMVLAANLLVHPFLLKIDSSVKDHNKKSLSKLILKLSGATICFGILATILGVTLGVPVFRLIYGIDITNYLSSLAIVLVGGTIFGLSFIISNALTAMRKTAIQTLLYSIVSVATFIISYFLIINYSVLGGSITFLISMILLFIGYVIIYLSSNFITDAVTHTFVVLAYKESKYLETCIKSVINQTKKTNVIIFTTTPNSHIENLAKKYHLPLKTGTHKSIGGDFDSAIESADTTLVTIAHQDDFYNPEYAAQITRAFIESKQPVQIIFSDYYEIRGTKNQYHNANLMIKRLLLTPLKIRAFSSCKWAKRAVLKYGNAISCPAVTFNKEVVKLPLFECNMVCNVDWQAWEKLSRKKGSFIFVQRRLMGHRIHEESETTKTLSLDQRSKEDYIVYSRFWPQKIAKLLTKLYKQSEKSNNL